MTVLLPQSPCRGLRERGLSTRARTRTCACSPSRVLRPPLCRLRAQNRSRPPRARTCIGTARRGERDERSPDEAPRRRGSSCSDAQSSFCSRQRR